MSSDSRFRLHICAVTVALVVGLLAEGYAHLAPESTRTLVQILAGNAGSRPLYGPRGR